MACMLQELTYWAEGSPENQLRRNTLDAIPTLYDDAFNDPGDGWEGSGNLGHVAASPGASSPGATSLSQGQSPISPGDPAHIMQGQSPSPSHTGSARKDSEDGDSIFSMKGISRKHCCFCISCVSCLPWCGAGAHPVLDFCQKAPLFSTFGIWQDIRCPIKHAAEGIIGLHKPMRWM